MMVDFLLLSPYSSLLSPYFYFYFYFSFLPASSSFSLSLLFSFPFKLPTYSQQSTATRHLSQSSEFCQAADHNNTSRQYLDHSGKDTTSLPIEDLHILDVAIQHKMANTTSPTIRARNGKKGPRTR